MKKKTKKLLPAQKTNLFNISFEVKVFIFKTYLANIKLEKVKMEYFVNIMGVTLEV